MAIGIVLRTVVITIVLGVTLRIVVIVLEIEVLCRSMFGPWASSCMVLSAVRALRLLGWQDFGRLQGLRV